MNKVQSKSAYKKEILDHLKENSFLNPEDPNFFHESMAKVSHLSLTWESDAAPRHDHGAPDWLTATEFSDADDVFEDKIEWLLALLKISSKTVLYTGAGISTAAGVGQAARGGASQKNKGRCSTDARPTLTHRALAAVTATVVEMLAKTQEERGSLSPDC